MAKQQTIKYAPQWNNMTMDNVIFQTNNVVGNFNYLPNVPTYKPIMKFLRNCLLYNAFTNCPSVVYQNFLREFWSTAVAFDPFLSTDEPEKCPLKEFLIKVLNENYSSTKQVNSIQQLLAYSLIIRIRVDIEEIIYNDLGVSVSTSFGCKDKKGKSRSMALTLPKSQGLDASEVLSKKRTKPKSKRPTTETKESPPKPIEGSKQSHSGTHKSQPLPESTVTPPKDLEGNDQPLDKDLTFMTSDEGMTKTTMHPKGLCGDKDSRGHKPPADMEPLHTTNADLSGTGAKYQEDQTQSSRLREVRTPSSKQDQLAPSHVQESASDSASPDLKRFDNILPLTERQLIRYLRKMFRVFFNRITKKQYEQHKEAAVPYVDLKASVDQYYDKNIAHKDQTNKLVEAFMIKDDPATNQKINEAIETFARISFYVTETALKREIYSLRQDNSEIKSMMTKMYAAFKVIPLWLPQAVSLQHLLSLTFKQILGRECNHHSTKEPPSHTEGETEEPRLAIPIS
nr:hypothetical protein [Tanacetum cinerariifolium]